MNRVIHLKILFHIAETKKAQILMNGNLMSFRIAYLVLNILYKTQSDISDAKLLESLKNLGKLIEFLAICLTMKHSQLQS